MAALHVSISLENFIGLSPNILILISIGNAKRRPHCNLRIVKPIINFQQMYNLVSQNYINVIEVVNNLSKARVIKTIWLLLFCRY